MTAQQLFRVIYLVSKRQVGRGSKGGGGYVYAVPNQWQGKHRELLVIGDRKAGATAYEIASNPESMDVLDRKIQLEKKFIHVVRNPFNTIATTYRKTLPESGQSAETHLSREIQNYFARCSAVRKVERRFGNAAIHFLHQERLIEDPIRELKGLCGFLGVDAFPDYLSDCAGILMMSPHETRLSVGWTDQQIAAVRLGMKEFHWLASYEPNS